MHKTFLSQYKRELLYTVLIFVAWQFAIVPTFLGAGWLYSIIILLGSMFVLVWLISNYVLFAYKGVSKYSEVLVKIDLKQRFFAFFITPLLFYFAVSFYLAGVESISLRQSMIILSTLTIYFLFVHIRSSYEKVFTVERSTRYVFQIVDLLLYYIGVTGFVLLGTSLSLRVFGAVLIGFLILVHQLLINKQYSFKATVILLLSVVVLLLSAVYFVSYSALLFPIYMSVVLYLILTVWGLRLNGITKLSEYITPVMFTLMALMILLSF